MSSPDLEPNPWSGHVLLHFLERRFAEVRGEIQAMLSTSMAFFMRDVVYTRSKVRGGFVVLTIDRYDWAKTLSGEQRAFLRRHCEAVYISRGFPPSEDDLPPSAG